MSYPDFSPYEGMGPIIDPEDYDNMSDLAKLIFSTLQKLELTNIAVKVAANCHDVTMLQEYKTLLKLEGQQ